MKRFSPARAATATAVVLATSGGLLGAAVSTASAAVTCTSPVFKRQFFANTAFSGTPKKTDCDSAIDQNWGTGAPASGLPSNNFGVRWSVTRDFGSGGPFTFTASSRDGIRVYLDGVRKVDLWKNVSSTVSRTVNLTVPAGRHSLRIDFVNWTGSANVTFAYAPRTSATVDKVKPLTPGGAALTYSTTTHKAKLSWTRSPEMDLAGYRVYRRVSGGSYPAQPLATTTSASTSWTDTPPKDGKAYFYEVRAYDKAGNASTGTADKGVTTVDLTGPAAPTGLRGATDFDGAHLTWSSVVDAVRHEVVREDPRTGEQAVVATDLHGTAYHDREHMTGVYQVRGIDAAGNPGALSDAVTLDGTDTVAPAAPSALRASARPGVVHTTFRAPLNPVLEEIDNGAKGLLYRTEGTGAAARTVAVDCDVEDGDPVTGASHTVDRDEVVFQCADRTRAEDTTYTYTARIEDGSGNASAPSAPVTLLSTDRTAPAPLTGLTATPRDNGVELRWDTPPEDDIDRYRIRRGTTGGDGSTTWQDVTCTVMYETPHARLCPDLPDGQTVTYTVRAEDHFGNMIPLDDARLPRATTTERVVTPGEPVVDRSGPVSAGPRTSTTPLAPVWFCSGVDECAGITGYRVSRWTGGGWQSLGTAPGGVQGWIRHEDPYQLPHTVNWYRVVAVRADGTELPAVHTSVIRHDVV
ncbi:PA14 domain-containing protein [Streptomyces sp. NPDC005012]|uniref:PA14 domain-containing protein n=1 Tax=Streptomyces sp. NPDC005012 TaxID=3154558 RepID=UPI0033B5C072